MTQNNSTRWYRIEYYESDGSSSPLDVIERYHPLHYRRVRTLRKARSLIRAAGCRYGQWSPDEPGTVTAYHESRQEGCGGYAIIDETAEKDESIAACGHVTSLRHRGTRIE